MQQQASWKMPAGLDGCYPPHELLGRSNAAINCLEKFRLRRLVACPVDIVRRDVHGAVERLRPDRIGGVVMRVGDDDGFEGAFRLDLAELSA